MRKAGYPRAARTPPSEISIPGMQIVAPRISWNEVAGIYDKTFSRALENLTKGRAEGGRVLVDSKDKKVVKKGG